MPRYIFKAIEAIDLPRAMHEKEDKVPKFLFKLAIAGLLRALPGDKFLPQEISYSTPRRSLVEDAPYLASNGPRTTRGADAHYGLLIRVPGYYLEEADRIIHRHNPQRFESLSGAALVDLGTGNGHKIADFIEADNPPASVLLNDLVWKNLDAACNEVCRKMRKDRVRSVQANFNNSARLEDIFTPDLRRNSPDGRIVVSLLGGTLCNYGVPARRGLLSKLRSLLRKGDALYVSTDSTRHGATLRSAYGEAISASYFMEGLTYAHTLLGVQAPDPDKFRFGMRFNAERDRVELALTSLVQQDYKVAMTRLCVSYGKGEIVSCGESGKPQRHDLRCAMKASGFVIASEMPYEEAYAALPRGPFASVRSNIWELHPG